MCVLTYVSLLSLNRMQRNRRMWRSLDLMNAILDQPRVLSRHTIPLINSASSAAPAHRPRALPDTFPGENYAERLAETQVQLHHGARLQIAMGLLGESRKFLLKSAVEPRRMLESLMVSMDRLSSTCTTCADEEVKVSNLQFLRQRGTAHSSQQSCACAGGSRETLGIRQAAICMQ